MYMFRTDHTNQVNENVFQHLSFCIKVSLKLQLAICCFLLHGLTGGLWSAPEKFQLKELSKWIHDLSCKR